jgi:catechol-2,3-dioxygenase
MSLQAVVMFVSNLARSQQFYCDIFQFDVSEQSEGAALLTAPGGNCLVLREFHHAVRTSTGLGLQYLIWGAPDRAEFERCTAVLKARNAYVSTSSEDGIETLEGRDPDRIPVLVTFPGGLGIHPAKLPLRSFAY